MLLFGLTHNDMLLLLQGLKMTLWLTLIGSANGTTIVPFSCTGTG